MVKPAWVEGNLMIARSALDIVEAAGLAAYGRNEEACGYLSGPGADALLCDQARELENLANKYHRADPEEHPRTGREYFKINALKFERAIDDGKASGRPVKVFFHSHLDCGAYFSDEDAASMTMGGNAEPAHDLAYLVSAIDDGHVTAHRLFVWVARQHAFVEGRFSIV